MFRIASALLLLTALSMAGAGEKRATLTVTLRASAGVSGGFVRLGDVALLSGKNARAAGKVLLGPVPKIGSRSEFKRNDVAYRLEEEGFDRAGFSIGGSEEVVVHADTAARRRTPTVVKKPTARKTSPAKRSKTVSPRDKLAKPFAKWVRAALAKRLSCDPERLDIHVGGRIYGTIPPEGIAGLVPEVHWPVGRMRLGRQNITVVLRRGRERVARLQAYTEASARMKVLVSTRNLKRDELIMPGDLRKTEISLTDLGASYLTDSRGLAGACAARAIRAGQPLQANMFKKQKLVQRGQAVTVVSEVGAVRITEKAVAKSDGGLGDVILVERRDGRPALSVRIAGNGIVKVD